ncbi:MAG: tRNA 2-thiouridine(34) synthase MnmA [Planctomycetes bacterium]|nr:tRNA 2-thiouridine(34) synthase MnmA [Planctomycetota bacterium]
MANPKIHLLSPSLQAWKSEHPDQEIAVLMSGGVDSSVTALLLQQAGWRVLGITMKIPVAANGPAETSCCGDEAVFVASSLKIPHYFLEVAEAFAELIITPFRQAYAEGRTPSPCVDCNAILKFGLTWELLAQNFGIRYLATGHYSQVVEQGGRSYLRRGSDHNRDQSYFLYRIPPARLPFLKLPMGGYSKDEIRNIASENNLHVAQRADSMELCFAGEGDYRAVLNAEETGRPGPILDLEGNILGEHQGIENYTLGQRRQLGIAAKEPLYVLKISPSENAITVGTRPEAYQAEVRADKINILIPESLRGGERLLGRIRSTEEPTPCEVTTVDEDSFTVRFDSPRFAPAPGQHLVLYDNNDYVVGGGTIC